MIKKIVVVEDQQPIGELVMQLLEFEGFAVEHCLDSMLAHEQIKEYAPQLVILDLMMPEMDGWAVLDQLRADPATRKIKVIICTSYAEEALRRKKDLQRMSVGVLLKPFDIGELLRLVYKTIGEP